MVSEPPRPSVVTSLESWLTPWKPATSTIEPSSSASRSRLRGDLRRCARRRACDVVIMPACEPVNERAWAPSAWIAIATSALEMRSPAVSSMSISRGGGAGRDLLGEVEQLVGGVAHGGDHHDDVVALFAGADDPLGDLLDPIRVLAPTIRRTSARRGPPPTSCPDAAQRDTVGYRPHRESRSATGRGSGRNPTLPGTARYRLEWSTPQRTLAGAATRISDGRAQVGSPLRRVLSGGGLSQIERLRGCGARCAPQRW